MQTDHDDHNRRFGIKIEARRFLSAQHLDQLVMNDLDHLLARGDRTQNVLTNGLFSDSVDETARDRQSDIGFQQSNADFAHRIANVLFLKSAPAFELVKDAAKAVGQIVKHRLQPQVSKLESFANAKNAGGRELVGQRGDKPL